MSKANTRTNWSDEDYLFLKKHYEKLTYKEIGEKIGKTKSAVQNKMRILGLQKPDKYYYNKHFFDVIDTEEKAYWLGFFLCRRLCLPDSNKCRSSDRIASKRYKSSKEIKQVNVW